ncbi:MAG: PRC-barrel domain-containing protein [Dehalococcoidales bacterium]|nr:PRC-barrel domain-containing protein [Dehalococcoidales bacterium]
MYTSEVVGKEVLDANANKVGKVADIDVDLVRGTVNHMVVKAGFTKKYIVSLDKIDKIGDRVVLKIGEEDIPKK